MNQTIGIRIYSIDFEVRKKAQKLNFPSSDKAHKLQVEITDAVQ